jgi:hypothetical protein
MIHIPSDFAVQPLKAGETAKDKVTCGTCGLSWDDGISTGYTPTPSGRCPFEAFHVPEQIPRYTVPPLDVILQIAGIDDETACAVYAVLSRKRAHDFTQQDALQEVDKLLGNHGIESIEPEGCDTYTDGVFGCPPLSYSNNGDSYAWTLVRDHAARRWMICGWADALEEYERENETGDYETFEECPDRCPSCHAKAFTLKHYPHSARGDSYSWICDSCNHHCLAVDGYTPEMKDENESD